MIDVLRNTGWLMMAVGALLVGSWFIEPLRDLWPVLLSLPMPVKIGLVIAATGLLVVFATVVQERLQADDRSLRETLGNDD
jgi:hypothetical protein